MYYLKIILILILISFNLPASEIDQFTDREKYQDIAPDFTAILNLYTNNLIKDGVINFNEKYLGMELTESEIHKHLAFEIYKTTAGMNYDQYGFNIPSRVNLLYAIVNKSGQGPIQTWIENEDNSPYWFCLKHNIYSGIYPDILNRNYIIKVGGEFLGPDKIDHFFDQGYSYWIKSDFGQNDLKAKEFGIDSENGWYGLLAGGVFSFADLRANWGGYQFYKNLFSGENSLLLVSHNGIVSIRRNFDWTEYIDWQFDELKNPSLYTDIMKKRIYNYIKNNFESYRATIEFLENRGMFHWIEKRDLFYLTENMKYVNKDFYEMIKNLLNS